MPKPTKTPGFALKIEAFVPSAIADTGNLRKLQELVDKFADSLGAVEAQHFTPKITPTRR